MKSLLKKKIYGLKQFLMFIRFGEVWRKDTFKGSNNFYKINKVLNASEFRERYKLKEQITNNLNTKINEDKGYAKFKLNEIKNYEVISESVQRIRSEFDTINWNEIEKIRNSVIINCTPTDDWPKPSTNIIIDAQTHTKTGRQLALMQAAHQYNLYTGLVFPFHHDA